MSPSIDPFFPSGGTGPAKSDEPVASPSSSNEPLPSQDAPLPSSTPEPAASTSPLPAGKVEAKGAGKGEEEDEEDEEEEPEVSQEEAARRKEQAAKAKGELRKGVSRFILFFLGFMGLYMLIDNSARNSIALAFGGLLAPAFGFGGHALLATMFFAAALEMGLSAVAYHFTTDWIESATVAHHQAAIRPLWMKAVRSQKKEHMEALKPHMDAIQVRQSKVTIAQFKGMVITWVLLIAIYTWMGLYIAEQCPRPAIGPSATVLPVGSPASFNLTASVLGPVAGAPPGGYAPYNYTWWATGLSTGGAIENASGPHGKGSTFSTWSFKPQAVGAYTITLLIIDARGSVGWGFQGLQYGTTTVSPPSVPVPPFACKGSSVLMFGDPANLLGQFGPFPLWFAAFSLYTVPLNLIFRRYLKHAALAQKLPDAEPAPLVPVEPPLGGA
ncbi:MAG: DUF106 domain-containing protein [Euryarchaeota archaeon]|nr:DUF106 domain-containing protein [Euryarchaeota archaeon]MDE1835712.1 DUF106 domain-containing protein [Euryarchaeota archaeon]MDE1880864.1 DUF106 domain-containing protein [Euryarchaeota archaeon]MDE2043902.1 DUF106 domain-containing protein [Thermoplasmata archaeon]